jgi:hypothetical protein
MAFMNTYFLFASLFLAAFALDGVRAATSDPGPSLASAYSLKTSTTLPFPTSTLESAAAQTFLTSNWGLNRGRIPNGGGNLAFVQDPLPNSTISASDPSQPVLRVTYPQGSYSHDTGGAQFYSMWNTTGDPLLSVVLSYELAFDTNFNWVQGGKLPGLRGGPKANECSGGNQPSKSDQCFSARLMWRRAGAGEVYAYIPTKNNICRDSDVDCNNDFGTSIGRGSFSFSSGDWQLITLFIRLNHPVNVANGAISLYYNGVKALEKTGLQIRATEEINIGGLYFSTFFGGNDDSWATPVETHTYYRNFKLWGGTSASNLTGSHVNAATSRKTYSWLISFCVLMTIGMLL